MATQRFVTYADALAIANEAHGRYEAKDATIVRDASYVHTDNNFTSALKASLEALEGAEVIDYSSLTWGDIENGGTLLAGYLTTETTQGGDTLLTLVYDLSTEE